MVTEPTIPAEVETVVLGYLYEHGLSGDAVERIMSLTRLNMRKAADAERERVRQHLIDVVTVNVRAGDALPLGALLAAIRDLDST